MKHTIFSALFSLLVCSTDGQMAPDLNMPNPYPDMPEWAHGLYNKPINLVQIDEAYTDYYKKHPFAKNQYTRYYKRLIMQSRMQINNQGFIESLSASGREQKIQQIKSQSLRRSVGPDWRPYSMETFWLEKNQEACPWQVNVYAIDVSKTKNEIVACTAETGGFYLSENAGMTWEQRGKEYSLGSEAIIFHPNNPDTIYLGTSGSIKKSNDRGNTWVDVFQLAGLHVYDLEIPANNPVIILAATSKGLFRSINSGMSWTQIFAEASCELKINPSRHNIVYAMRYNSTGNYYEPWKSTNSGASFNLRKTGWHDLADGGVRMAVSSADAKRVYAIVLTRDKGPYLMRSNDEGDTWLIMAKGSYDGFSSLELPMENWQGFYDLSLVASQTNADHLITGTASCFKSMDGGKTFTILGGYGGPFALHPDFQASVSVGNHCWIATDGGLTYSSDFFTDVKNAEARNRGLNGSDFWGFDLGWNENIFVGGRYHNGNTVFHENYRGKFIRMGGAEAATGYINPIRNRQVFFSDIGAYELPSTPDNNWKWFSIPNSQWPNESYYPMEHSDMVWSPLCYNTVFIGKGNQLLKSINNGSSYTALFTSGDANDKIECIEISRSNPDVIYITIRNNSSYDGKVLKSTDGGAQFTVLSNPPGTTNAERRVHTIALSPTNENEVYLALRSGGTNNKVFKSLDGGNTWTNLTTRSIQAATVSALCYQYGTDGGIYIACDGGLVFYRNRKDTDWSLYGNDLSVDHFTRSLRPFYRDEKLINGSNMGVWEIPFVEPSLPLAQASVDKQISFCVRDTFYFEDYSVLLKDSLTRWIWSFPGASYISDSTVRNPKVVYATPGIYDVQLTVQNSLGSNTKYINQMIELKPSQCEIDSFANLALDLRTRGDYASLKAIPELQGAAGFTCAAWIKLKSLQDCFTQIISNWNSDVGFGFGFAFLGYRSNTNLTFYWKNVPYQLTSPFNLDTNTWVHVALVVYPDSVRLYRNGESWTYKGDFNNFDLSLTPWEIGRGVPGQCGDFQGELDELKLYNRSLSEEEIRKQMHLIYPNGETGLVGYYQFNESSDDIYNKAGAFHGANGGAKKIVSTAPVGTGAGIKSDLMQGENNLEKTGIQLEIDRIVSNQANWYSYRLLNQPDSVSASMGNWHSNYWIIRSFGIKPVQQAIRFQILDSLISLTDYQFAPHYLRLYRRAESNEFLNNWQFVANASWVDVQKKQIHFQNIRDISGQFALEILENPTVNVIEPVNPSPLFLYPNPAYSQINVSCYKIFDAGSVVISDSYGKNIWSKKLTSPFSEEITTAFLMPGVYYIRYGQWLSKFVKL